MLIGLLLLTACNEDIKVSRQLNRTPSIWPDYKGVTVPPNIAPLNFCVTGPGNFDGNYALIIEGAGLKLTMTTTDSNFDISPTAWHDLLAKARGTAIRLTVCKKGSNGWEAFKPFSIQVATDSIDSYLAYRLIPPGYGLWYHMGIYQRNLENYDETAIVDNNTTDHNCVNCHSFPNQQADKMVFHMRAAHKGTYLVKDGHAEHIDREGMPPLVYPYWHPSEVYRLFFEQNLAVHFHQPCQPHRSIRQDVGHLRLRPSAPPCSKIAPHGVGIEIRDLSHLLTRRQMALLLFGRRCRLATRKLQEGTL